MWLSHVRTSRLRCSNDVSFSPTLSWLFQSLMLQLASVPEFAYCSFKLTCSSESHSMFLLCLSFLWRFGTIVVSQTHIRSVHPWLQEDICVNFIEIPPCGSEITCWAFVWLYRQKYWRRMYRCGLWGVFRWHLVAQMKAKRGDAIDAFSSFCCLAVSLPASISLQKLN